MFRNEVYMGGKGLLTEQIEAVIKDTIRTLLPFIFEVYKLHMPLQKAWCSNR